MLSRMILRKRVTPLLGAGPLRRVAAQQWRTNTPAPKEDSGPLMERRADRDLPEMPRSKWRSTLPIFIVIMAVSSLAVFNYEKMSSPVTASTLYSLRRSEKARELLGDEIYFKNAIPWISGEMNHLKGNIDITFTVKGTKGWATMRFSSLRPAPKAMYETTEWTLTTPDGKVVDLLEDDGAFETITLSEEDVEDLKEDSYVRGFRKSSAS